MQHFLSFFLQVPFFSFQDKAWVDVSESICYAHRLYFDNVNSLLLLQYYPLGTMITFRTIMQKRSGEPFAVYFTSELLHVIDQLHRVGIIHGDLKVNKLWAYRITAPQDSMSLLCAST